MELTKIGVPEGSFVAPEVTVTAQRPAQVTGADFLAAMPQGPSISAGAPPAWRQNLGTKLTPFQSIEEAWPMYADMLRAFAAPVMQTKDVGQAIVKSGMGFLRSTPGAERFHKLMELGQEGLSAAMITQPLVNQGFQALQAASPKSAEILDKVLSGPSTAVQAITGKDLTQLQQDILAIPNLAWQTALFAMLHTVSSSIMGEAAPVVRAADMAEKMGGKLSPEAHNVLRKIIAREPLSPEEQGILREVLTSPERAIVNEKGEPISPKDFADFEQTQQDLADRLNGYKARLSAVNDRLNEARELSQPTRGLAKLQAEKENLETSIMKDDPSFVPDLKTPEEAADFGRKHPDRLYALDAEWQRLWDLHREAVTEGRIKDAMALGAKISLLGEAGEAARNPDQMTPLERQTAGKNPLDLMSEDELKTKLEEAKGIRTKAIRDGTVKAIEEALQNRRKGPQEARGEANVAGADTKTAEEHLITTPRSELPTDISQKLVDVAQGMKGELESASRVQQGSHGVTENVGKGWEHRTVVGRPFTVSSFPQWFTDLGANKEAVLRQVQKVLDDEGKDKVPDTPEGRKSLLAKVKAVMVEHLSKGRVYEGDKVQRGSEIISQGAIHEPPDEDIAGLIDLLGNKKVTPKELTDAFNEYKAKQTEFPFGANVGEPITEKPAEPPTSVTGAGEATPTAQPPLEQLAPPVENLPPSPLPGQTGIPQGVGAASIKEFKPTEATRDLFGKLKRPFQRATGALKQALAAMSTHHEIIRDAAFMRRRFGAEFEALADGSAAKKVGFKEGSIPPDRRMLLIHAFQQPDKYESVLTPYEKAVLDFFKKARDEGERYAEKSGIIDAATLKAHPDYLFQWWTNEKTGEPYSPIYGQFSKGAPQLHERVFENYEEGIRAGKIPATDNLGTLVGYGIEGITRAAESRNMFKSLYGIEADGDLTMLRTRRSSEAKPLRMIESWSRLKNEAMTDGYTRYDSPILDKAIMVQRKDGSMLMLKGPIGVKDELLPYVRAYFESPHYGSTGRLMFAFKTVKLMGGFHIWSLNFQALAGAPEMARIPVFNVIKGLGLIKGLGDEMRILYRNGLALHGFEDTGDFQGALSRMAHSEHIPVRVVGKVLNATSEFTFNVVHPGIKAFTAYTAYGDLTSRESARLGRELTEPEKNAIAKQAVNYTDRLFSGEDYRTQVLQGNEWMAKNWYSPEAKKVWQSTLLSPTWQKEHLGMLKDVIKSISIDAKKPEAYLYRRYLYGALSIYGISNLYNWVMTKQMDGEGKLMIDNPSAFTVRAPWNTAGGQPVYIHPLKSIFEVPEFLSDPLGKIINKVSPWVRTSADLYTDIRAGTPTVRAVTNAIQNIGVPISGVQIFDPNQPVASQVASAVGLPAYPKTSISMVYQMAHEWGKKTGKFIPEYGKIAAPGPYTALRQALDNGRMSAAAAAYNQLLQGTEFSAPKTPAQIAAYFKGYTERPFAGSKENERDFYASLSESDKKVYKRATAERERIASNFFHLPIPVGSENPLRRAARRRQSARY